MRKNGFTLIEILITLAIAGIIMGVTVASFTNYETNQTLLGTQSDLVTALQNAKSKALAQVKPSACDSTMPLSGYRVDVVTASPAHYDVVAVCNGITISPPIQSLSVPSGVTVSPASTFFFPVLNPQVTITGGSTVTLSLSGLSKTVSVDSVGNIVSN